jgi:hypothetical protein
MSGKKTLFVATALVFGSWAAGAYAAPVNLDNASFEGVPADPIDLDPSGWGTVGVDNDSSPFDRGSRVSTDFAHGGAQSVKMDFITGSETRELFSPNAISGDASQPVTFTFWAYTPADANAITNTQIIGVIELKNNGTFVPDIGLLVQQTSDANNLLTPGAWKQYTVNLNVPGGAYNEALFHIKIESAGSPVNSGAIYFDDAQAFVGAVPEPTSAAVILASTFAAAMRRRRH